MEPIKYNIKIRQGTTLSEAFKWESSKKRYIKIVSISNTAPVSITTDGTHDIPPGWRIRIVGAQGMKEINSVQDVFYVADNELTTGSTVVINSVNAITYGQHTSNTGVIECYEPAINGAYEGLMQVRSKLDSDTVLLELSTANSMITVDQATSSILLNIPSSITQELNFSTAVYSLELKEVTTGRVIPFLTGSASVIRDATIWPTQLQQ